MRTAVNYPDKSENVMPVLTAILRGLCEQDRLDLAPDMLLADIPGIDSLRILQAIALMEEHFAVEVDVIALESLFRVSDMIDIITNACGAPAP